MSEHMLCGLAGIGPVTPNEIRQQGSDQVAMDAIIFLEVLIIEICVEKLTCPRQHPSP